MSKKLKRKTASGFAKTLIFHLCPYYKKSFILHGHKQNEKSGRFRFTGIITSLVISYHLSLGRKSGTLQLQVISMLILRQSSLGKTFFQQLTVEKGFYPRLPRNDLDLDLSCCPALQTSYLFTYACSMCHFRFFWQKCTQFLTVRKMPTCNFRFPWYLDRFFRHIKAKQLLGVFSQNLSFFVNFDS